MSGDGGRATALCVAGEGTATALADHAAVDVRTAADSAEALDLLADCAVDCVVGATADGVVVVPTATASFDELARAVVADADASVPGDLGDRVVDAVPGGEDAATVGTAHHFQELAAHTTDVLWMFDADWAELLFANPAYETVFDRTLSELCERPRSFLDAVHDDDRDRVGESMARISAGESVNVEYRVVVADGVRWVQSKGEPITDGGEVVRVAGFTRDVTERHRREAELERQNERLDRFASVVSHDLRNPLNVASGHLELAREECDDEHLDAVEDAHDRMAALIEDLLVLARGGDAAVDRSEVALASFARECWEHVETGDAALRAPTDRTLRADEGSLARLLENLFRNSVEHGAPEGGDGVTVTVGGTDDGFYVADDGVGVPEADRERVFEPGYSTDEGGAGIGLDIVASVAAAHGWSVSLTESERRGARFEFALD